MSTKTRQFSYADLINQLQKVQALKEAIARGELKQGDVEPERKKGDALAITTVFGFLDQLLDELGDPTDLLDPIRRMQQLTIDEMHAAVEGRKRRVESEEERIRTAALACVRFLVKRGWLKKRAQAETYKSLAEAGRHYEDGGAEPKTGAFHDWEKTLRKSPDWRKRVGSQVYLLTERLGPSTSPEEIARNYILWTVRGVSDGETRRGDET